MVFLKITLLEQCRLASRCVPAIFAYLLAGPHVLEPHPAAPCISITEVDRHLTFREIGLSLNYFFYHNINNAARIKSY